MAKRIEEATGIETRATILGHMQRGGSPSCKDRVYASMMGSMAVDLLAEGKTNRVVAYKNGEFVDYDIDEALAMTKDVDAHMYEVSKLLCRQEFILITSTGNSQIKDVMNLIKSPGYERNADFCY